MRSTEPGPPVRAAVAGPGAGAAPGGFTRRVLSVVGLATLAVGTLFLAWQVAEILLLAFAGVLLAVLLRSLADWVAEHPPLGGPALLLVLVLLAAVVAGGVWFLGARIAGEIDQLQQLLPQALRDLGQTVRQYA